MRDQRRGEMMKLGAFFHPTGNHVAAWLHPEAQIDAGTRRVALFLIVQLRAILYRLRDMTPDRTPTEIVALSLLAQDGVAAIWQLHLSAALAYRDGQMAAATGIIEIADAAEREWLRAKAAVTGSPG